MTQQTLRYFDELKRTMEWLAQQPRTLFIGQTVAGPGTFMHQTLRDIPKDKAHELPVNESFQMQFTLGLALDGWIPISVYPRQNFLLLAVSDMVNMVDKVPQLSDGQVIPHIIIRTASGPYRPVHPGCQHVGNFKKAFEAMFSFIKVVEVLEPDEIFPAYKRAYETPGVTLIIEEGNFYQEK